MRKLKCIFALVVFLLVGCGSYPQRQEDQATFHTKEARAAIAKSDRVNAAREIDAALARPTGEQKIRELLSSNPSGVDYYLSYLEDQVNDILGIPQASDFHDKILNIRRSEIFPSERLDSILESLASYVSDGNMSGRVPIVLGDDVSRFPILNSEDHQKAILDRSIQELQSGRGKRRIDLLMEHVRQVGSTSEDGRRIESLLPSMNIKKAEIAIVSEVFPEFAETRLREISAKVFLVVNGGDRILREEILDVLRREIRGIDWVNSPDAETIILEISQERYTEKSMPERMQTVVYAYHEVDILSAALLMPSGASYLYDIFTGGAEIDYGYVVKSSTDDSENIVRGKVGGNYSRCQNARIQNVFGGVTSADFVANSDMRSRCAEQAEISVDKLRGQVFKIISEEVRNIPSIKKVHDAN